MKNLNLLEWIIVIGCTMILSFVFAFHLQRNYVLKQIKPQSLHEYSRE